MKKIIVLFLLVPLTSFASTCKWKEVKLQYNSTLDVLNKQILQLNKMREGESFEYLDLNNLFGEEYSKGDKAVLLKKISEQMESPYKTSELGKCLVSLKKEKEFQELIEKSDQLKLAKIEFLKTNLNLNNVIDEKNNSQKTLPTLKDELEDEKNQSNLLKKELESKVVDADKEALSQISQERKELAFYQSYLAKTKIDIINQSLSFITSLETKIAAFEKISEKLNQIMVEYGKEKGEKPSFYLNQVDEIWLEVIKGNFNQIFKQNLSAQIPEVKSIIQAPKDKENTKLYEEIIELRGSLQKLRTDTITQIADKKNHELKLQNSLLIQVNMLRSRIYQDIGFASIFQEMLTTRYWSIVISELKASPYRIISFLYEKYLYVSEKLASGREGQKKLTLDFFSLLLILLIFFGIHKLINKLVNLIDDGMRKNAHKLYKIKLFKLISSVWTKLKKESNFYIWFILLGSVQANDLFSDFHLIIDFVMVYLIYKVIVSLVTLFLGTISKVDYKNYMTFKVKAHQTSTSIGRIYLFYGFAMLLIHGAVGKVYFYTLINLFALGFFLTMLVKKSSEWNEEFLKYLERNFSGQIVSRLDSFLNFIPHVLRAFFYLVAIFILQIFNLLIRMTENFEISKKISANLFKKQIESLEVDADQNSTIPQEYKDLFDLHSLEEGADFVSPSEDLLTKLYCEINEWADEKSDEHSLVIYGDKGIGKTTLIKHLCQYSEKLENQSIKAKYLKMPSKVLSKEVLSRFFKSQLGEADVNKDFDLLDYDSKLDHKIVIAIDETQNVFLSHAGGFEAYYELIDLVNLPTKNIFWLFSFNKYSWLYLDRAFGRNLFFRNIFEIRGWNDQKIKELIMTRHRKSSFRLSYDLLISATKSAEEIDRYTSIESKFFTLLWELSNGNPRAALYLWPTSLTRKRRDVFNVNIPKLINISDIGNSNDNILFVLTSVLKHENTTVDEIAQATNLPVGIVRNSLKIAQERGYLYKDSRSRFMIEISTQNAIIKYLKMKNFIYGN